MRVLVDECLPKQLKRHVTAELVKTVPEMGWAGRKNGALMRLAEGEFDILLTNDQNLEHQQNLAKFHLAVIVLAADTNDIADLVPLMVHANDAITRIKIGEIVYIEAPSV